MCKAIDDLINDGIERGMQQGIEQGIEQGMQQGIEQGKRIVISKALKNGKTPEEIAVFFNIDLEYVMKIQSTELV